MASPARIIRRTLRLVAVLSLVPCLSHAGETYRLPSGPLVEIVDAPATPGVSFAPGHEWMLLMERPSLPPIAELAEPELRLAGVRLSPRTSGPSRGTYVTGLTLKELATGAERAVEGLPAGARISQVRWSPDGRRIAFALTEENGITLWTAAVEDGRARRVSERRLNAVFGWSFLWFPDSRSLACLTVPGDRGPEPAKRMVPEGPVVQESNEKAAPAITFQDLLQNSRDEALFEHYFTSQAVILTLDGKAREVGPRGILLRFEPSPDGRYLLTEELHRPWSYLVPYYRFPRMVQILDVNGKVTKSLVDLPLQESVPSTFGSVPVGPRSFAWRDDAPATLVWAEARDGGDARTEAEVRDEVLVLAAPFTGESASLIKLGIRYGGITWGTDNLALVNEWWWKSRQTRTWMVRPGTPSTDPVLLWDRSSEDRYSDPGTPVTQADERGRKVILTGGNGAHLYLLGEGASEEGNRPFVDRLDLGTLKAERLWQSEAPFLEIPQDLLDADAGRILTSRESPTEPPNYFIRDLGSGTLAALTAFPHPTPFLKDIQKELIHYSREDGVKLTGTLYLPPGYRKGDGPLPVLMWAYPQEFKSADAAGQVTRSPYRFDRVAPMSALVWVSLGYAVLDNPTMPIVGEGNEDPNDSYVQQLVAGARAAAEELIRRGVGEAGRMAIGGHSYGAFTAANLLAHSDIFSAAIARSGAYNRTLTPFGFQSEERNLWEAPQVYSTMSPFIHADRINEPILLIHGEADNNPGTHPIQSERLFDALKGLGRKTRLVMLPHESHGYRARESILHMLWESEQWLDEHVRKATPVAEVPLN